MVLRDGGGSPREDASIVVKDILQGFTTDHVTVIEDRGECNPCRYCCSTTGRCCPHSGRGHETVMYYEGRDVALDDREEAREALEELGFSCTTVTR